MQAELPFLEGLPRPLLYGVLAFGAAVENFFPVIPADTFIVAGGFLAATGKVSLPLTATLAAAGNLGGAILVYWIGRRHGPRALASPLGRRLIAPGQLARLTAYYERRGVLAIFFCRFLPGFRAIVPVFAGATGQRAGRVVPPLVLASAIWYGALVWLGYLAGDNYESALAWLRRSNAALLAIAVILGIGILILWLRTRRASSPPGDAPGPRAP